MKSCHGFKSSLTMSFISLLYYSDHNIGFSPDSVRVKSLDISIPRVREIFMITYVKPGEAFNMSQTSQRSTCSSISTCGSRFRQKQFHTLPQIYVGAASPARHCYTVHSSDLFTVERFLLDIKWSVLFGQGTSDVSKCLSFTTYFSFIIRNSQYLPECRTEENMC